VYPLTFVSLRGATRHPRRRLVASGSPGSTESGKPADLSYGSRALLGKGSFREGGHPGEPRRDEILLLSWDLAWLNRANQEPTTVSR
jgi:hypothetical protein